MRRLAQPTGLCVAFLGADGSGKSSVVGDVVPLVAPAFRRTAVLHLRPRLGMRQYPEGVPVTDPHGAPPRGALASLAKLGYLVFDYGVGYLTRIWPARVRSTFVVFDRYYHDLLVDPRRYRYGGPMWLARAVGALVPKPDLWVVLDAPPDVLRVRCQDCHSERLVAFSCCPQRETMMSPESRVRYSPDPPRDSLPIVSDR